MSDDEPTQMERAAMQIGAELSAIRQELTLIRRAIEDSPNEPAPDDSPETWACRCGAEMDSEAEARNHAQDAHNAPPDGWQDIVTRE